MERLYEYMRSHNLDAFYIARPVHVNYMSPYTGADSYLFITEAEKFFITDPRYTEQASIECPDYTIINHRLFGSVAAAVASIVERTQIKTIGFEDDYMTVDQFTKFKNEVKAELVPASGVIEQFRAVKSAEEIECLRISCDIASRAFELICKEIRVGVTEKELAARLSYHMVMQGADTQPYGNILISGARTSLLHGIPSAKAIEYGDLVLMDYGCQYHGYLSDMTRTVVVGKANAKQKEVYALEKQMVEDVESILKEGVKPEDGYLTSTKAIKDTEYFKYHYNNIGHGIGMFVHEIPFMKTGYTEPFRAGNVVTVEPGIYIPGWGGIRIEDQVLITKDGCENMISATKELIEL